MEKSDVVFEEINNKGIVILNRPKALNALTLPMVVKIANTLKKWETEKSLVIIKATGDKAFCAGGDIRSVYESRLKGDKLLSIKLQQVQFQLAYLTKNYRIPLVSIINGITLGGGGAISMHSKYCVVTEKASFGMPEVAIGFVPDVGTSYTFARLSGKLGWYLALTGQTLNGADVCTGGIATNFCQSHHLAQLEKELIRSSGDVANIVNKFSVKNLPDFSLTSVMPNVNKIFSAGSVEKIFEMLKEDKSDWAKNTLKVLQSRSPSSLKIILKQITLGETMSFIDCLKMEYRLTCCRLEQNDFYEGVRAVFDKKYVPNWIPAKLEDVSGQDVENHFRFVPKIEALKYKL